MSPPVMFNTTVLRWSLMAISALAAVVLGFSVLPDATALATVKYGGYYFIFAATAWFVVAAWREFRAYRGVGWTRNDWFLAGLALLVTVVWQVNEVHGFKILMDELVLNATSMSMHFDRHVFVPMKAQYIDGEYIVFGGVMDKRPLFFPFLLSILHDVTGYRPGNVFILN